MITVPTKVWRIQGPEMSSIIRISDGFSAEFLGSFSHSQKFHRVRHDVRRRTPCRRLPPLPRPHSHYFCCRHQSEHPCRVRRSRDGGPEIRALIASAVPWLARAMAAETRLLIGHTSLCAAAAAVRTPMIANALVLHSRHRWKGDWRCLLGRGGPHACSVRQCRTSFAHEE